MTSYPKWIYHATHPARIVADAETHAAAGPEWVEAPVSVEAQSEPAPVAAKRGRPRKAE
jgi:hypothetical protein